MEKGEIYWADDKGKHPHPIVFLEPSSAGEYYACILSSQAKKGNIAMSKSHFLDRDENGNLYKTAYKDTHFLPNRIFLKEVLWLESHKTSGQTFSRRGSIY